MTNTMGTYSNHIIKVADQQVPKLHALVTASILRKVLFQIQNVFYGYSLESPQQEDSNEYPTHIVWWKKYKRLSLTMLWALIFDSHWQGN